MVARCIEEQVSKQGRQALAEAKHRTAELDARIESLVSQLSTANQENDGLRNTAKEAESARTILAQELKITKVKLLEEQEKTAKLRKDVNGTQIELATLQAILAQTQQKLQASLQANTDEATAHNLESTEPRKRIEELETQLSTPFAKRLRTRAKKLKERFGTSIGVPGRMRLIIPVVQRV
jgi:chromosome segregation ATPase